MVPNWKIYILSVILVAHGSQNKVHTAKTKRRDENFDESESDYYDIVSSGIYRPATDKQLREGQSNETILFIS